MPKLFALIAILSVSSSAYADEPFVLKHDSAACPVINGSFTSADGHEKENLHLQSSKDEKGNNVLSLQQGQATRRYVLNGDLTKRVELGDFIASHCQDQVVYVRKYDLNQIPLGGSNYRLNADGNLQISTGTTNTGDKWNRIR